MKATTIFQLILIFIILAVCTTLSCGDDDDDSDEDDDYTSYGDDDEDDDDWDSEDDDADVNDDVDDDDDSFIGNCETQDEYEAMQYLFEDCYWIEDGDGNLLDAEAVCLNTVRQDIECFMNCYNAFDECGGDPDPLFDCMADCLGGGPDDDDDDFPLGSCETQDEYEAMEWLFEECYTLEDGEGNEMDADDVCLTAAQQEIECFMACYDAADECGGDPDPLFDCLEFCLI